MEYITVYADFSIENEIVTEQYSFSEKRLEKIQEELMRTGNYFTVPQTAVNLVYGMMKDHEGFTIAYSECTESEI